MGLLAYSAHGDAVDAVRSRSILGRRASEEVQGWMRAHGVWSAVAPVALPAAPELGMAARVCVPVRDEEGLLGFLWLADEPGHAVGGAEVATAVEVAAACAVRLRADRRAADRARGERTAALQAALAGEPAALAAGLPGVGPWWVLVLAGAPAGGERPAGPERPTATAKRLAGPAERPTATAERQAGPAERLVADGEAVAGVVDGVLAVVVAGSAGPRAAGGLAALVPDGRVGLSEPVAALDGLPGGWAQARAALRVAVLRGELVVRWGQAGADGRLALLADDALGALADAPELERLARGDRDGALRATLAAWLDRGGDAAATAAALTLHRASLYHRLRRIEELAGVDLGDGDVRLRLHLALRAAVLLGG